MSSQQEGWEPIEQKFFAAGEALAEQQPDVRDIADLLDVTDPASGAPVPAPLQTSAAAPAIPAPELAAAPVTPAPVLEAAPLAPALAARVETVTPAPAAATPGARVETVTPAPALAVAMEAAPPAVDVEVRTPAPVPAVPDEAAPLPGPVIEVAARLAVPPQTAPGMARSVAAEQPAWRLALFSDTGEVPPLRPHLTIVRPPDAPPPPARPVVVSDEAVRYDLRPSLIRSVISGLRALGDGAGFAVRRVVYGRLLPALRGTPQERSRWVARRAWLVLVGISLALAATAGLPLATVSAYRPPAAPVLRPQEASASPRELPQASTIAPGPATADRQHRRVVHRGAAPHHPTKPHLRRHK